MSERDENGRFLPGHKNLAPKKVINWETVEAMAKIGGTMDEICGVIGVDDNTLRRRCLEDQGTQLGKWLADKRAHLMFSLRRRQFMSAMGEKDPQTNRYTVHPSITMQIFLGKQYLGQVDKVQNTNINYNLDAQGIDWRIESYEDVVLESDQLPAANDPSNPINNTNGHSSNGHSSNGHDSDGGEDG